MEKIRDSIRKNVLLADGATGTYISSLTGRNVPFCELLNIENPGLVYNVHRQYVLSGSRLITTNTFSANTYTLRLSREKTNRVILAGIKLARRAAGAKAFVAADFGPVSAEAEDDASLLEEYRASADIYLDEGMDIFLFETFASADVPVQIAEYIKSRRPDAFVITDFAVTPDGRSRLNLKGETLISEVRRSGLIDAAGFNCGSGPTHLLNYASRIDFGSLVPVLMPNAGYPGRVKDYFQYSGSPEYFAGKIAEAAARGFKIVGGCCGTTPEHIRRIAAALKGTVLPAQETAHRQEEPAPETVEADNGFYRHINGKKVLVAELDPPFDSDVSKLEAAAVRLARCGVDAVTVSDSPLARPRADSVCVAARLKRTAGVEVIPHIACRDKNLNALKSSLLAAHMEDIRNILAVTGDPVSESERGSVKGVFNLNSAGLCSFVRDMNGDVFQGDPIVCGCAFNVNALNPEQELNRLMKKVEAGARFALTQPVYSQKAMEALAGAKKAGIRLIAGILPPLSYKNALFLANEISGIDLPQNLISRFSPEMPREEGEQTGISLAVEIAEKLTDLADGYYLMTPFNRIAVTVELIGRLKESGLL